MPAANCAAHRQRRRIACLLETMKELDRDDGAHPGQCGRKGRGLPARQLLGPAASSMRDGVHASKQRAVRKGVRICEHGWQPEGERQAKGDTPT